MKLNKTQKKYRKAMDKMAKQGKLTDQYGAKIKKINWKTDERQKEIEKNNRSIILMAIIIVLLLIAIVVVQKYNITLDTIEKKHRE